jgi:hypothetical protein
MAIFMAIRKTVMRVESNEGIESSVVTERRKRVAGKPFQYWFQLLLKTL